MSALTDRIAEDFAAAASTLPGNVAAAARRRSAISSLAARGLPSTRDENWKYANLRSLERVRFRPAPPAQSLPAGGALPQPLPGIARWLFIDGRFAPAASATPFAGAAVRLLAPRDDDAVQAAEISAADERFALLNEAFASDGLTIDVPSSSATALQLEVLFLASAAAQSGASYPRLEVRLAPGTQLTLIERHLSAGSDASFVTSAVQVEIGRGARLEHYRLQELNARSILFDTLSARLAEEATYRLQAISTGAQAARSTLALALTGQRAELALAVAALGDAHQVQDTYALVEHAAPDARTLQTFRGIAAGRARVAFNGKIIVAPGAHGTDSRQSLRGLLAGPEAEIDVRPQLEIYTDDVRCSHGATAGKLDDDMLFYLLARGLDRDAAQRLLKWAFLEDVISQIALSPLRRQVEERLAGQLRDDALRELL
ncbi:MAG TPA: Fe-S cluster assembly protein SufD [Steroidobacteraceae bacterium]|nr:Fe-S cluster assembly protein SufD [Steroidobacteraceae bacterium]